MLDVSPHGNPCKPLQNKKCASWIPEMEIIIKKEGKNDKKTPPNLQLHAFSTTAALSCRLLSSERHAILMATVQGLIFKLPQTPVAPTNEAARRAREAHRDDNASWLVVLTDSVLWAQYGEPLQSGSEDKIKISSPLSQLYNLTKSQIKCRFYNFDSYCEVYTYRRGNSVLPDSGFWTWFFSVIYEHDGGMGGFCYQLQLWALPFYLYSNAAVCIWLCHVLMKMSLCSACSAWNIPPTIIRISHFFIF